MAHFRVVIERHEAGDLTLDVEAPDPTVAALLIADVHPGSRILSLHEFISHQVIPAPAPAPAPASVTEEVPEDQLGTQLDA